MKTWLRFFVTLALCAALLVFVVDIRVVAQTLARCDLGWALVALAALTVDRVLMSYKWGLLLAIRGYITRTGASADDVLQRDDVGPGAAEHRRR